MQTIEEMDRSLANIARVARIAIAASHEARQLPQNAPLWEEIRATTDTAEKLLAYAEVGQWASSLEEKQVALGRATELARKLDVFSRWMQIPLENLASLHAAPREQ